MNFKKIGKVLTSKSVRTGPSSYKKRIYRVAVSQRLRNTAPGHRLTLRLVPENVVLLPGSFVVFHVMVPMLLIPAL